VLQPGAEAADAALRRHRLLDIEARLRPYRAFAFGALGLGLVLSGPWIGWIFFVPLGVAVVAFAAGLRMLARSERPELWSAAMWAVGPAAIAGGVAASGGPDSPGIAWFAVPLVGLDARFERRGVALGMAYTVVLLLASTVGVNPGAVADSPQVVVFPLALIAAVSALGRAIVLSDRDHRTASVVDRLTGLSNRAAFDMRMEELKQRPWAGTVGVLICDIDHFKRVNDTHGHKKGDLVLQGVAEALRRGLRLFEPIYRVGGEEFVVVVLRASEADCAEIAERLRTEVAETRPAGLDVTMSFGVAAADGEFDLEQLFERADAALYEAKRSGRNRVVSAQTA